MFTRFYNYMMYYTEETVMTNGMVTCRNVVKPTINLLCGWLGLFITIFCVYVIADYTYTVFMMYGLETAIRSAIAPHRFLLYIFLAMGVVLLKYSNKC